MRKHYLQRLMAATVVVCLMLVAAPIAWSQDAGPKVIPSDSVVQGRTFGEWSAAWWQWAFAIPVSVHPLMENGDCSVGQSGPVWFLGGSFAFSNAAVRTCNVPAGKYLYFPVLNGEDSKVEESFGNGCSIPIFGDTIVGLRKCAQSYEDGVFVNADIDGSAIPHLTERSRVQSTVFGFTLPDDNVIHWWTGNPYTAGTYFPAVDDGYYVMLSPLPPGNHVIHFHGWAPSANFSLDITYYLTVSK